jgi:hypothetical protein
MFPSDQAPGSDAWYDDLESWMASRGVPATTENVTIERERLMLETGAFIPDDYRFLRDLEQSTKDALRKAS